MLLGLKNGYSYRAASSQCQKDEALAYYEKVLQKGESVQMFGRLHWIVYAMGFSLLGLAALLLIILSYGVDQGAAGLLAAAVVVAILTAAGSLFSAWIRRFSTEMVVTNRRVIYKTGLIRRRTVEMNISKIETVDVAQGIFGRIVGFGTVIIRGTGTTFEPLRKVANPLAFRNAVLVG